MAPAGDSTVRGVPCWSSDTAPKLPQGVNTQSVCEACAGVGAVRSVSASVVAGWPNQAPSSARRVFCDILGAPRAVDMVAAKGPGRIRLLENRLRAEAAVATLKS